MTNMPKISARAAKALDILANGGEFCHRLERNSYTGREQFQTRLMVKGTVIKGYGFSTRDELERAGFQLVSVHRTSVSTYYKLKTA